MANSFTLIPRGPFSLEAATQFLEGFTPAAHAPSQAGHLHLAFPVDGSGEAAGVCCRQPAGTDSPVIIEIEAGTSSSAVRAQVARVLSLDLDGSGFPEVAQRDPVVAELQQRYPGLRPVAFYSPYEAGAWGLISARTSIRQASGVKARMAAELGEPVEVHGELLHAFPTPARLRTIESFRGLFGRKVEWLRALADATLAGLLDAERLREQPKDKALAELRQLPGVGPFTAELILLRGANVQDVLPAAEPRLLQAVALAYGLPDEPSHFEVTRMAEAWRPYRTWVVVLLRRRLGDDLGMSSMTVPATARNRRPASGP